MAHSQAAYNVNFDSVRQSVVFLHFRDDAGELREAGTAFLLAVPSKSTPATGYWILVTARHIVDPEWAYCPKVPGTLFAVFNTKKDENKPAGDVEIPLSPLWMYSGDASADVAVTLLNMPVLSNMARIDNQPISISELPTREETGKVDTGSQVISAGLLLGASGVKRNYPIFKFGYVSNKIEEPVSVSCVPGGPARDMKEWMIAASLVAGNSGSPILFVPPGFGGIGVGGRPFILGVQSASFAGSDVAGMTPVEFLVDAIRRMNIADIDLSRFDDSSPKPSAAPTSATPQPVPIPLPVLPSAKKNP